MNYRVGQFVEVKTVYSGWIKCKIINKVDEDTWDVYHSGREWWYSSSMLKPLSALHALAEVAE